MDTELSRKAATAAPAMEALSVADIWSEESVPAHKGVATTLAATPAAVSLRGYLTRGFENLLMLVYPSESTTGNRGRVRARPCSPRRWP